MNKKNKEISAMSAEQMKEKLQELKLELVKKNVAANKSGKGNIKEIKKAVARILTAQIKSEEKNKQASLKTKSEEKKTKS